MVDWKKGRHPLRMHGMGGHSPHSAKEKHEQDVDWTVVFARCWADPGAGGFRDRILGNVGARDQEKSDNRRAALRECGLNPDLHGDDSLLVFASEKDLRDHKKADDDKATEANPNERLYRLLPEQPGDKVNADGELLELWNLYAVRWFREQYGTNTGAL